MAFYSYPPNESVDPTFSTLAVSGTSALTGNVGIGGASNAAYGLSVTSASLTTTNQIGVSVSYSGTSAATAVIYGLSSSATSANSSFTCAFLAQFAANNPTKGAASTITRQLGYYVAQPNQGASNAAIADNATFSGSFFLHSTSAFKSFMTGAIANAREDVASAATITALSSSRNVVKLTGATATALQGITAGLDGQRLCLINLTGANLTVQNENAGATAANRITTMTGADVASVGNGVAEFIYDTGSSRWICLYVSP